MKAIVPIILALAVKFSSFGQGLEDMPPVLLDPSYHIAKSDVSFITTVMDYHEFAKQGKALYSSGVEIFDADQPWPPRWFTSTPFEWHDSMTRYEDLYSDARVQDNGQITFFNRQTTFYHSRSDVWVNGYIICNKKLEAVDTFRGIDLPVNYHDFRINSKGEKLVIATLDTTLNTSELSCKPTDTNVKSTVDVIEIYDHANHLIFRLDPVKELGVQAFHWNYRWNRSFAAKPNYLDWSHANAIDFDFDGNIIYSFRDIGIGKISRADGHIMWHFDRNDVPFVTDNDTIEFYMQHGFDKLSDNKKFTTYEMYSNGEYIHNKLASADVDHPGSYGLLLRVSKNDRSLYLQEKKMPNQETRSNTAGNYEVEKNGDYLMNYGYQSFRKHDENVCAWPAMEFGNEKGQVYAIYTMPELIVPFKIHRLKGWRPPRPTIMMDKDHAITAHGEMKEWVWYRVSETTVRKVGEGMHFVPKEPGVYCVAGKYGVGWSVSLPFSYGL